MKKDSAYNLKKAEGIWQIDKVIESPNHSESLLTNVHTFIFDGEYLTVRLISFSPFQDKPEDDIYLLATSWVENTLYYLPPLNAQWQKLASFEDTLFVMYGDGKKRLYKKVLPSEVAEWNADLTKPDRSVWNYQKFGIEIKR